MSDVEYVSCERIVELEQKEREYPILEEQIATMQRQYVELLQEYRELLRENEELRQRQRQPEHVCCNIM